MLPVAPMTPPVEMLPPVTLPENTPVVPVTAALEFKLPAMTLPVTPNVVNVPTDVILVCAAVDNVPVMFVPDRFPAPRLPVTVTLSGKPKVTRSVVVIATVTSLAVPYNCNVSPPDTTVVLAVSS